jgi:hypothetical protein
MAKLTHDDLAKMTMPAIAKKFGVKNPKPGTTKADFIDQVLAQTTQPVVLDGEEQTVTIGAVDVTKEGRFLPALAMRTPDGLERKLTPLGGGRWREEFSPETGHAEREGDGGVDALWDGTTLVLPNLMTDIWGAPEPFEPFMPPTEE